MEESGCDAELRLRFRRFPSSDSFTVSHPQLQDYSSLRWQIKQNQVTMFYAGKICITDITKMQARAIISMAKRELDYKNIKHGQRQVLLEEKEEQPQQLKKSSLAMAPQGLNQGLSMKRSLQQFLQKRKTKIRSYAPYHQSPNTNSDSCSPCSIASCLNRYS